jgi:hypothetical protein
MAHGTRYCRVVLTANGNVKPDVAVVNGKEERHPAGAYHLECREGPRRVRLSVGKNAVPTPVRGGYEEKPSRLARGKDRRISRSFRRSPGCGRCGSGGVHGTLRTNSILPLTSHYGTLRTEFVRGRSLITFRPLISKITVFRRQGLQPFGICCLRSGVFSSFLTEFGSGNGSRRTQAARAMNEHAAAEHYRPVPASPLHTPVWHDR